MLTNNHKNPLFTTDNQLSFASKYLEILSRKETYPQRIKNQIGNLSIWFFE